MNEQIQQILEMMETSKTLCSMYKREKKYSLAKEYYGQVEAFEKVLRNVYNMDIREMYKALHEVEKRKMKEAEARLEEAIEKMKMEESL